MLGLPYILIAALVAVLVAFGGGWHYGSKGSAVSLAKAEALNQQLAGQLEVTQSDCQRAMAALKADNDRRKRAAKAAEDAAAAAAAESRATVNRLLIRAQTAVDSEQNCSNARDILNQLALDR